MRSLYLQNQFHNRSNYNNMGLSERLVTLRKEKKIAQGELAKKVGIHPNIL